MKNCDNCRFSRAIIAPEPLPQGTKIYFLGFHVYTAGAPEYWRNRFNEARIEASKKEIICARYPKTISHEKTFLCGEWKEKESS